MLNRRDEVDRVFDGASDVARTAEWFAASSLYQGPSAVLTACISRLKVSTIPSNVSTLCFSRMFSAVREESRELFNGKKSLTVSYGHDARWVEARLCRDPVHRHPLAACGQDRMASGHVATCSVEETGNEHEEQDSATFVKSLLVGCVEEKFSHSFR